MPNCFPSSDSAPPPCCPARTAGLVYRAMGFPPQFFTVLFAIPRITGYLAHWRETLADPDTKIVRPQQDYRVRALRWCCVVWLLVGSTCQLSLPARQQRSYDENMPAATLLAAGGVAAQLPAHGRAAAEGAARGG